MRRLPLRSPPRMRGKAGFLRASSFLTGITPAYAGKRRQAGNPHHDAEDHPRVCGEKHEAFEVVPYDTGITPAYAGKRASRPTGRSGAWDHPRVCGEKIGQSNRAARHLGSPPRMRGKAPARIAEMMLSRITPACAGKSLPAVLKCPPTRDHPRVCGEKPLQSSVNCTMEGSPPRMRGKGVVHVFVPEKFGITPAYAGKSHCRSRTSPDRWDHPRVCGEK